jgi:hypothetical protein
MLEREWDRSEHRKEAAVVPVGKRGEEMVSRRSLSVPALSVHEALSPMDGHLDERPTAGLAARQHHKLSDGDGIVSPDTT